MSTNTIDYQEAASHPPYPLRKINVGKETGEKKEVERITNSINTIKIFNNSTRAFDQADNK